MSTALEPTAKFDSRTNYYRWAQHSQRNRVFETVIQGFEDGRPLRHEPSLGDRPGMRGVRDWR